MNKSLTHKIYFAQLVYNTFVFQKCVTCRVRCLLISFKKTQSFLENTKCGELAKISNRKSFADTNSKCNSKIQLKTAI